MADKPRVFISGVSDEFKTARNAVGADLRACGCEVTIQSDFRQGPNSVTLLNTLHDYIRDCHAVVCLIGKRAGGYPPKAAAERFNDMLPPDMSEASYTQWEYVFARYLKRRLYIYVANNDWKPDKVADPDAQQATFVQFLKDQGVHWDTFSNVDQLARAILKEDFSARPAASPPQPTKPIVLPYPSLGPLFKGREGFMRQLHDSLRRGKGNAAITSKALYGLGGIGKTRVAVEYARAHSDDYTALLFVVAEKPEALRRNLAALAATLVPDLDTTDDTVRVQGVLDWLTANPGWFLILDNLDTKEALAEADALLAKLSGGHVVITSRLADFSANFEPLALDVLPVDDAAAFLLERTKGRRRSAKDDEIKARTIAVELDGLALALEQASAFIGKHKLHFDGYLEQWRSAQRNSVLNWFDKGTVTGYPRAVAVTWQASVAQLTEPGRHLLERLAWLAPEKVPEFLLDVPIPGAEHENLQDALADLAAYSLVTRDADGPFFLVHRLVQDVTRRSLTAEGQRETLVESLKWIVEAFPSDPADVRSWPRAEALEPHARAVATEADRAAITTPTGLLMNQVGLLLSAKALYTDAEALYERSLAIQELTLGKDHREVGTLLNNLGSLYRDRGRYAEAEPLLQRAIAISEIALGKDHPNVATFLNNLAEVCRAQGRDIEAESLYQRALAIREAALGTEHADLGAPLSNLAQLYLRQGRDAEAEPLCLRSLEIREKALGKDHPDVGTSLNELARIYESQGREAEAEPLYTRSLAIYENALGKDHPYVGTALNNLASLYESGGRYAEAEPLYQRSLAIWEMVLGKDHPDVGNSLNNLAVLYSKRGLHTQAEPLFRRAIDIFTTSSRKMGRAHPSLEAVIGNYMQFLAQRGRTVREVKSERARLMRWQD